MKRFVVSLLLRWIKKREEPFTTTINNKLTDVR